MSMTKSLFVPVLLASLAFAACDQSKAELESTKQQLQTTIMERDNLRAQLDASKKQTAALAQQINDVQAKLTAAMAALAAPPETGKGDKKSGAGGKTGSAKPSEAAKAPAP
jgi:septal ring factor EnvC (AmiA/AmiB activator)